jgi:hypothetical protein
MRAIIAIVILTFFSLRLCAQSDTLLPEKSTYAVMEKKGRWMCTTTYSADSLTILESDKQRNRIVRGIVRWHKDYDPNGDLTAHYRDKTRFYPSGHKFVRWCLKTDGKRCLRRSKNKVIRYP